MRWMVRGLALMVLGFVTVALAPAASAQGLTATEIADELFVNGSYVEVTTPSGFGGSVGRLNNGGTAFVWLDSDDDAQLAADAVLDELSLLSSPYRTVLVLTDSGVAASSETVPTDQLDVALDASFDAFARGDVVNALDSFDVALAGRAATTATTSGAPTDSSTGGGGGSGGGGGGFGLGGILLVAAIAGGGFLLFQRFRNRGKAKAQVEADMEADRSEITEQLRDNADHVLQLGDRVIASGNAELIALYEKASATYQDVSLSIEGAGTPEQIDELDDRLDEAEWQFESIEAQLEGRPVPPSPAEVEAQAERDAARSAPGRNDDRPALGPDESIIGPGPRPPARAPSRRPAPYPRGRRSGRGRGGGLGGLGGVLGSVILGGGLGGGRSRRSTRRSGGGIGFPSSGGRRSTSSRRPGGRTSGGGLGGGVLRRGGGSRRSRGGSGRSFGRGGRSRSSRRF